MPATSPAPTLPAVSRTLQFDAVTLRRYDKPGPRYTSYPTAPAFTADFGAAQLREHALRTNEEPIPKPLSLLLPPTKVE